MDIEEIKQGLQSTEPGVALPFAEAMIWMIEQLEGSHDLQVARLEPGDVVVISVPIKISMSDREILRENIQELFPGHQVFVLDNGVQLTLARNE